MKGAAWGRQEGGGPGLIRGIVVASVGGGAKDRAEPEWECHFFLVSEDILSWMLALRPLGKVQFTRHSRYLLLHNKLPQS